MLQLVPLSPATYIREVLPHSAELWAGARDYATYVAEFEAICASGFGRRRLRTVGLEVDGTLVASCKLYRRELRCESRTYRAIGIGAVFTPPALRGRGYATALLGAVLDAERANGIELAYLFSDIAPQFYERIGFIALPSRSIVIRASALSAERIAFEHLDEHDDAAIERCFAAMDARRAVALSRPPLVWEFLRLRERSQEQPAAVMRLGIKRQRRLVAYVIGRRFPMADTFALDECAFVDDDAARLLGPLLRAAAGDLRKVVGWLPPSVARAGFAHGAIRRRKDAIAMFLPLSTSLRRAWSVHGPAILSDVGDAYWAADHI